MERGQEPTEERAFCLAEAEAAAARYAPAQEVEGAAPQEPEEPEAGRPGAWKGAVAVGVDLDWVLPPWRAQPVPRVMGNL